MSELNVIERDAHRPGFRPGAVAGCYIAGEFYMPAGIVDCTEADPIAICDGVIDLLSVFFEVSGKQLRSPVRTRLCVARVRQIAMYVAHVTLGLRMAAIGDGFGRNKSTVVHACHTIEDMRDDEDFDRVVARAEKLVLIAFSWRLGREPRYG